MIDLPKHVAIIMDGNGRWAELRNLPRLAGHKAGAKSIRKVLELCVEKKIEYLTLFAFSIENWNRPESEVSALMELFLTTLQNETENMIENNVRLQVIGDYSRFNPKLYKQILLSQEATANNTGLTLTIAANYSGRWDIITAVKKLMEKAIENKVKIEQIDEDFFQQHLSLRNLPEPDLFIRTSGEKRLSNFMLWHLTYSELYFTDTLWPDFDGSHLNEAIQYFASRNRRYGLLNEQAQPSQQ